MGDSSVSSGSGSTGSVARDQDRQIDDLKSAHEKKLARLRAEQEKQESEVRASGEAAVNHIRKSTDDTIKNARNESEQKLSREDESISKNYASLKRRTSSATEAAEKEINAAREHADHLVTENHNRETAAIEQSQEKIKDFVARQRELRSQTEKTTAEQIRDAERRGNQNLRKVSESNSRELREIETDHKVKVGELTEQNKDVYNETKAQAALRLSQVRREEDLKLKHERDEGNADYQVIHQKSHDEIAKEQAMGQTKLATVARENQRKLEENRDRSLSTNEKTQAMYSKEAKRLEVEGSKDMNARVDKFNHLKVEEKQAEKDELNEMKADHFAQEQQARTEHESHLKETIAKLSQTLNKQTDEFKKKFAVEAKNNVETLHNQKEKFLKEEFKQRASADKILDLDNVRMGDTFYKPQTFDANLSENEDHYVLTAKVPSYEKDNVAVRVQGDRVVLSGTRMFKDAFKDAETKTETSTHQSYRQEFPLARPADAKRVLTTISDDGTIRSIIPKKGFTPKV